MCAKIGTSHKNFTISQYKYIWLLVMRGPTLSRSSCQSAGSTRRYDVKLLTGTFSSSRNGQTAVYTGCSRGPTTSVFSSGASVAPTWPSQPRLTVQPV